MNQHAGKGGNRLLVLLYKSKYCNQIRESPANFAFTLCHQVGPPEPDMLQRQLARETYDLAYQRKANWMVAPRVRKRSMNALT